MPPTESINKFVTALPTMSPDGGTAVWDALSRAVDVLEAHRKNLSTAHPDHTCRRRIIVLTDGQDQHSKVKVANVTRKLQAAGVTVDGVVVARDADTRLRAVTHATGGGHFRPSSLLELLSLFESESFLATRDRTAAGAPPAAVAPSTTDKQLEALAKRVPDSVLHAGAFRRPLPHALQHRALNPLVALQRFGAQLAAESAASKRAAGAVGDGSPVAGVQ